MVTYTCNDGIATSYLCVGAEAILTEDLQVIDMENGDTVEIEG